MPRKGKRKSTPAELDKFFERKLIAEEQYGSFWEKWWESNEDERSEIISELLEDSEGTVPGIVTTDIKEAETQADLIDGYVVRRNKKGQFSKRGKYYQALPKRRKKK